jgi:hypothetical protein
MHISTITITAAFLSLLLPILGAPLPAPGRITNGTPCFGSTATSCTLKHGHKRSKLGREDLTGPRSDAVAEPEAEVEVELVAREPEPVAKPQSFVIGKPCFGSVATGCTLKQGHKREEELLAREPAPEPIAEPTSDPQAFVIGKPCFGSVATGCTLKQGH